jgi:hypothetical protein
MTSESEPELKPVLDNKGNPVPWVVGDPRHNLIEALGLLKDWVTTFRVCQLFLADRAISSGVSNTVIAAPLVMISSVEGAPASAVMVLICTT